MESLNNYIVERIRIDNVKNPKFPIDGTLEDIIQFLKENGFVDLTDVPTPITGSFNRLKIRGFLVFRHHSQIYFADTSKNQISRNNPVFIYDSKEISELRFRSMDTQRFITKDVENTMELLNKRFGF